MLRSFFLYTFILLSSLAQTQNVNLSFDNAKKVDENRYKDIKGSPYLFDNFGLATIVSAEGHTFTDLRCNYNGESKSFEVRRNDEYIDLDPRYYLSVEIQFGDQKTLFKRGLRPDQPAKFYQLLHQGGQYSLLKDFSARIDEKTIQSVGETKTYERFGRKAFYYLVEGDKSRVVNLNKKAILSALQSASKAESISKKEKLKLKSEADLVRLLKLLESN